jgi:putative ABC transport system permease protein
MKYLPLVWAGLWRKPMRTIFTLLSILVAFFLFGLLQGVDEIFNRAVAKASLDRIYVQSRLSLNDQLPVAHLAQIEKVPGVKSVAYASWFAPYFRDPKNSFAAFPTDPERYFAAYPELKLPKEQFDALVHTRAGAVIGQDLAARFGWKVGDKIPLYSTWVKPDRSSDWTFDIVGVFESTNDGIPTNNLVFNHTYFDETRANWKGRVGWFIVRIDDPGRSAAVGTAIDDLFANSSDETKTRTEKELTQSLLKRIGDVGFIVYTTMGAVFFMLLFLIGNTMMQAVRERIPEFAMLKTLGFSQTAVLNLVLAESLLLCVLGAMSGMIGAAAAFPQLKPFIGLTANFPVSVFPLGVAAAGVVAVLTTLQPAWSLKKLRVVDALAGR